MTVIHVVLPLLVGACIGYVTNYIAVKMLFRPHTEKKIGSWTIPFTPGVIPKNKPRIARACGDAIAGSLLSKGDIGASINEGLKGLEEFRLDTVIGDEEAEVISSVLEDKVMDEIEKIDIGAVIADKGIDAVMEKVKGSMLAMFISRDTLMNFAAPVAEQARGYIETEGREKIREIIERQINEVRTKTAGELTQNIGIDIGEIIGHVVESSLSSMDISGMVEAKINEMDVAEFEVLVLSVMKKELNAIVNLGALIGLVIGCINVFLL